MSTTVSTLIQNAYPGADSAALLPGCMRNRLWCPAGCHIPLVFVVVVVVIVTIMIVIVVVIVVVLVVVVSSLSS
jgi:hypothetical protein